MSTNDAGISFSGSAVGSVGSSTGSSTGSGSSGGVCIPVARSVPIISNSWSSDVGKFIVSVREAEVFVSSNGMSMPSNNTKKSSSSP